MSHRARTVSICALALAAFAAAAGAADEPQPGQPPQPEIPHAQDRPPGPALSPAEAMAKMELPPGFRVELAAAEPDVLNPTAMTFDDRGRIWLCESVEYPRRDPGKGKDRVKILEDTDGDGRYEKVTIFKDGLNIPCGVVHGNGGVYVTNSPDILFLKDTDGDDVADTEEVILTGFGRDDTHELPNNLMWGPDGWLYGMNGVFNMSKVADPASGRVYDFTCAIWRYHPPTKRFELFAEGTSNPWGLDYNRQGDWFLSCCVIDHMWHITQSGYYIRQGGPYPPLTVPLPSITTQKHQKAAYAGLMLYDAEVYPEAFRGKLLMGNLHGSAINQDVLERNGSTYRQSAEPDFLSANDAWFMPVAQRLGPDGCVYIMDWYDRYHCYQDANRDSPGLDRLKGRIYRIVYEDAPRAKKFDLGKASNDELLKLLGHSNVWWRRQAQRLLNERDDAKLIPVLKRMALDTGDRTQAHMHALWLLVSKGAVDGPFHMRVLASPNAPTRNWGVRAAGEAGAVTPEVFNRLVELAKDESPDVRAQVAIAAGRLRGGEGGAGGENDPLALLQALLDNVDNARDPLIPNLIYQNLKPLARERGREILAFINGNEAVQQAYGESVVRWIREGVAALGLSPAEIIGQLDPVLANPGADPKRTRQALQSVIDAVAALGLTHEEREELFDGELRRTIGQIAGERSDARVPATVLGMWWDDDKALAAAREMVADAQADPGARSQLLKALAERRDPANLKTFAAFIADENAPLRLRKEAIDALGAIGTAESASAITAGYSKLAQELRPAALDALTRSAATADGLLRAMAAEHIPNSDVTANHVRQIHALGDKALSERVTKQWGAVKTERDPERVRVVEEMRAVLTRHRGNPVAGQVVFNKACAQCHTIYGQGGNVGPDITGVGRENLDAILANVIDPNLVIGAGYFVNVARLKNGTTVSGLLVEQSDQRVVLKDGTTTHSLRRGDIARLVQQNISMMPEGLEKTISEQEFADLVAFLLTREPPAQPAGDAAGK